MYNEQSHKPMPFSRSPMQNGGSMGNMRERMRDIPDEERLESTQPRLDMSRPRRRCDGTLRGVGDDALPNLRPSPSQRNSNPEHPCPSNCARGVCGGWGLENHPLAMVYSPCQAWRDAYSPEVALARGTLFSELDLPFEAQKCKRGCM